MPRREINETRKDFSGGLNTVDGLLNLAPNELSNVINMRVTGVPFSGVGYAKALATRSGSRRLHQNALGGGNPIRGLIQWDAPGGKQIVAICNGNLYYRDAATGEYGAFTQVVPANLFSTTGPTVMAPFRGAVAGAPLYLYLCSANGRTYRWTGAALTQIDGTTACPNADLLAPYHTRMFMRDIDLVKHLFWSKVGDAEVFTTGAATDGGSALTDTLTGDAITAMLVIGGSLVVATSESLMRMAGYSNNDIQIAQDTEGISPQVGAIGPLALRLTETFGVCLSTRGAFSVTESNVARISRKIDTLLDNTFYIVRSALNQAIVQYNRGRREVVVVVQSVAGGETVGGKLALVYSPESNAWVTWEFPFSIVELARYQNTVFAEGLIAGCVDGFIRNIDYINTSDFVVLDDRDYANAGGSAIAQRVVFAPFTLGDSPGGRGQLDRILMELGVIGPSAHPYQVNIWTDDGAVSQPVISRISTTAAGLRMYRFGGLDTSTPSTKQVEGRRCWFEIIFNPTTGDSGTLTLSALHYRGYAIDHYEGI